MKTNELRNLMQIDRRSEAGTSNNDNDFFSLASTLTRDEGASVILHSIYALAQ